MNFDHYKVVLITGAASGIGEAIAKGFAKLSARLALVDINSDRLLKVKDYCAQISNNEVIAILCDVSKNEDIARAVDETYDMYGRIDVLVNNVGVTGYGGILDKQLMEVYDRTMNINLRSVVAVTHRVVPILLESKGCIVNISSIVSKLATKSFMPYSVAKAGLSHFTKCIALELASKDIRVNSILPGLTKTNLFVNGGFSEKESDATFESYAENIPLKRILNPEEIAELVIFLASEKAKGITGAEFTIDAGALLVGNC